MGEVILWVVVFSLMLAGVAGSLLPVVPGTPLVFAAALIYALFTQFRTVGWEALLVLGGLSLFSQVVDWLASAWGAKRYKATKWGVISGIASGTVGALLWGLPGILVGVFFGSLLAEWVFAGKGLKEATKVGWGSLLGFLGGTLMKFLVALTMVAVFLYAALT